MLEYFDGLVEGEGDETIWDEEGMRFAGDSEDESEEDVELDSEEEAMLDEILAGQGPEGTTRRILNAIYELQGADGDSSDEEDAGGEDD